jgi:virulence-associated protein VagC
MAIATTKIFRKGANPAVLIPAEMSLNTDTVTIERQGDALILRPLLPGGWDHLFSDPTLVLPPEFETGDDPLPQDRSVL